MKEQEKPPKRIKIPEGHTTKPKGRVNGLHGRERKKR